MRDKRETQQPEALPKQHHSPIYHNKSKSFHGQHVHVTNSNGRTALNSAADNSCVMAVQGLPKRGADTTDFMVSK